MNLNLNSNIVTPIHNCIQTSLENDYFKEKLTEFFKENKKLKEEIKQLANENKIYKQRLELNKSNSSSQTDDSGSNTATCQKTKIPININRTNLQKNIEFSSQTRCSVCSKASNPNSKNQDAQTEPTKVSTAANTFDNDIYNKQNKKSYVKLCEMQHNLLKKLEEINNDNTVKNDLINHMKIELDQLEDKCLVYEAEIETLTKNLKHLNDVEAKNKKLMIELEKYKLKYQKYKSELKCFDEKFFDEIEDLKYNYYESLKLNKYYEGLLVEQQKRELILAKPKKQKNRVKFAMDFAKEAQIRNEQTEDDEENGSLNDSNDLDVFKQLKNSYNLSNCNFDLENYNELEFSLDKQNVDENKARRRSDSFDLSELINLNMEINNRKSQLDQENGDNVELSVDNENYGDCLNETMDIKALIDKI